MDSLLQSIAAVVGPNGLLTGEDVSTRHADWLGQTRCGAMAVVRPASTEELSAVMKLCHAARVAVVPAGGLTGLVHGTDAVADQIQISMERMRSIEAIDPVGRTMLVQAGVPMQAAQEAAAEQGLLFAVDLGARGSATVGGNVSTNAGGNRVIRYGMMRENVLGLEAVLADGTVISSLNHLLKNNAGYDLKQLFIGSEGTLGLVTRVVMRLHPQPISSNTAILAVDSFAALEAFFAHVGKGLGGMLSSFEVMWREHYQMIAVDSGRHNPPLPGGHGYYVIVEASGQDQERDAELFAAVLADALEQGLAANAVLAASKAQAAAIWKIREDIEGTFTLLAPLIPFDVSLPIRTMEKYLADLTAAVEAEWDGAAKMSVLGHLGDGNLHIVLAPRPWSAEARARAEALVYEPLKAIGGSVSAEHGIGIEKRHWLGMSRSEAEIALMRQLKAALDPLNLLNPGKVVG